MNAAQDALGDTGVIGRKPALRIIEHLVGRIEKGNGDPLTGRGVEGLVSDLPDRGLELGGPLLHRRQGRRVRPLGAELHSDVNIVVHQGVQPVALGVCEKLLSQVGGGDRRSLSGDQIPAKYKVRVRNAESESDQELKEQFAIIEEMNIVDVDSPPS